MTHDVSTSLFHSSFEWNVILSDVEVLTDYGYALRYDGSQTTHLDFPENGEENDSVLTMSAYNVNVTKLC
jgi:hypothetical protein